jgi:hypothetical protein
MPEKKNILYCILVDDNGKMERVNMITNIKAAQALACANRMLIGRNDE